MHIREAPGGNIAVLIGPSHPDFVRLAGALRAHELRETKDASGHEHKGKGPGGGQFTSAGNGGATDDRLKKLERAYKAGIISDEEFEAAKRAAPKKEETPKAAKHGDTLDTLQTLVPGNLHVENSIANANEEIGSGMESDSELTRATHAAFAMSDLSEDDWQKVLPHLEEMGWIRPFPDKRPNYWAWKKNHYANFERPGEEMIESLDSSGHEHKGKGPGGGQFTSTGQGGGAGETANPAAKPKHGSRAAALHAEHQALKQKRLEAFNEIKDEAIEANENAAKEVEAANDILSNTPIWDNYTGGLDDCAFTDFETLLNDPDHEAPIAERFENMKEVEKMARALEQSSDFEDEGVPLTEDETKELRTQLKKIAQHARQARQHLKAYVQHRKEMQAIRNGEDMDVQESLMFMADGKADYVALLEAWDEGKHPRDHGKFAHSPGASGDIQTDKETAYPKTTEALHAQADKIAEEHAEQAQTLLAKFQAPAKWLRGKTEELRAKLTEKYGAKGAAAIFAAGQVITWGITIGAPLATGLPIVIPPGGGLLTSLALAGMVEAYRKIRGAQKEDKTVQESQEPEALSEDQVKDAAVELVNELLKGLSEQKLEE